jgi:hypothetical protein
MLTTLQASADAVGELDRTVSVDSSIHRVHQHGATAARADDHPGTAPPRLTRWPADPLDRTAYRRRNVIERLQPARVLARHRHRYDEHATVFHGAVVLASILI